MQGMADLRDQRRCYARSRSQLTQESHVAIRVRVRSHCFGLICLAARLGDCVCARTCNQNQVEVVRASQPIRHPGIVQGTT